MFPMTVTIHNQSQLNAVMSILSEVSAEYATTQHSEATERERLPVKPVPKTQVLSETTASDTGEPATDQSAEVPYEDAANAVTHLAKVKGRDAAVKALSKFGAAKLPDVKPDDYAALVKACKEAEKEE